MKTLKIACSAIAFLIAAWSVVHGHFSVHVTATLLAIALYVLATVFLLFNRLESAKIDLDDKSLELDADNDSKSPKA